MGDLNYVSVLRFCNWSENGCLSGDEEALHSTETGVYDLSESLEETVDSHFFLEPKVGALYSLANDDRAPLETGETVSNKSEVDAALALNNSAFFLLVPDTATSSPSAETSQNGPSASFDDTFANEKAIPHFTQEHLASLKTAFGATPFQQFSFDDSPENLSFSLNLVTVDDPNNEPATIITGGHTFYYGNVDHVYQISKNDITVGQYRNFLMAVARTADPYNLFNPAMQTNPNVASINRTTNTIVENGTTTLSYTYTVVHGMENNPITCVSYWSAVRFCNWMANGQPQEIGECNPLTTEDGSYCIIDATPRLRTNATWRLPTEQEWYKAAYYQKKTSLLPAHYWVYSTGDIEPRNSAASQDNLPDSPHKNANYCLRGKWTAADAPWITPVGTFSNSPGPFGTYDMGGNVAQITDSWILLNDPEAMSGGTWNIIVRGGSWRSTSAEMIGARYGYEYIDPNGPNDGASETIGFRVVSAVPPEKHTLASTLTYMFHEDANNLLHENDNSIMYPPCYLEGVGTGWGMSFAVKYLLKIATSNIAQRGCSSFFFGAGDTVAIEGAETLLSALGPPGVAAAVCLGIAAWIYESNVNDQTPYEANGFSKRTAVGCFGYAVSAAVWMIGRIIF